MRTTVITLIVVALIAIAGCSGGPQNNPTTDTNSSVNTTEAEDSELNNSADSSNSATSSVNGRELFVTHRNAGKSVGFEAEIWRSGPGTIKQNGTLMINSDLSKFVIHRTGDVTFTSTEPDKYVEKPGENETVVFKYSPPGEYRDSAYYEAFLAPGKGSAQNFSSPEPGFLKTSLIRYAFEPTGTQTINGESMSVYDVTGISENAREVIQNRFQDRNITVDGKVVVDGQGIIRNMTVALSRQGVDQQSTYAYVVNSVGDVTVKEPDWLSEACSKGSNSGYQFTC
ncbi:DUF7537 family lipoprotein (plasmid) [Halorientalis pallida]|uniref:DUF7537 family lipoprotein n=1 Tax=Halorientalis pallida TaxID=2479928 RepID=UPI003C6F5DAC